MHSLNEVAAKLHLPDGYSYAIQPYTDTILIIDAGHVVIGLITRKEVDDSLVEQKLSRILVDVGVARLT